jgi:hypothetical protein
MIQFSLKFAKCNFAPFPMFGSLTRLAPMEIPYWQGFFSFSFGMDATELTENEPEINGSPPNSIQGTDTESEPKEEMVHLQHE